MVCTINIRLRPDPLDPAPSGSARQGNVPHWQTFDLAPWGLGASLCSPCTQEPHHKVWPELPLTQGPHLSALRLASSGVLRTGSWSVAPARQPGPASSDTWVLTKRALSQGTASTTREGHNEVSFQHSDRNVSTCPLLYSSNLESRGGTMGDLDFLPSFTFFLVP